MEGMEIEMNTTTVQLTPDMTVDIDTLPAGRELDALIAEKVMEWPMSGINMPTAFGQPFPKEKHWFHDGEHYWREDGKILSQQFNPSISIYPAWEVLHLGHPCGWFDVYYFYRYGDGYAISKIYNPKDEQGTEAPTAPLVICRAALKAKLWPPKK